MTSPVAQNKPSNLISCKEREENKTKLKKIKIKIRRIRRSCGDLLEEVEKCQDIIAASLSLQERLWWGLLPHFSQEVPPELD